MQPSEGVLDQVASLGATSASWLTQQWLGLSVWQYILAFLLIALSLLARSIITMLFERVVFPRLGPARQTVFGQALESLLQPLTAFIGISGLFGAVQVVLLPTETIPETRLITPEFVAQTYQIALSVIVIWAIMRIIDVLGLHFKQRAKEEDLLIDVPVIPLLQRALKILVGVVGGVFVLQNAGYPIAGILGGLGIGGLAVALAAQDTLANVFGSIIIFTDKPFKVGDWVVIGDVEGFVETIGFRSTRIRTWPKALVTVPNKTIADTQITNWTAMPLRRVYFSLRIAYNATADQIQTLVHEINTIIEEHPGVDKGYYLAHFTEFGPDGFEIMIYYFTKSVVWKEHLEVKEEVNLSIMRLVEQMGLSIGKPGRDLYVVQQGVPSPSAPTTPLPVVETDRHNFPLKPAEPGESAHPGDVGAFGEPKGSR